MHTASTPDGIREMPKCIPSEIEVFPEFEEGLDGIEGFSHIFVICYFDRLRREQKGVMKVKPRRLLRFGLSEDELPLLGVFSLDSPSRPNPLGLSLASLAGREGRRLKVNGLDCFDGTPVVDIKPYQPSYRPESFNIPAWHRELHGKLERT